MIGIGKAMTMAGSIAGARKISSTVPDKVEQMEQTKVDTEVEGVRVHQHHRPVSGGQHRGEHAEVIQTAE